MMDDRKRIAGLVYVRIQRDTHTALGNEIGPDVFNHLEQSGLIRRPYGWPLGTYLPTDEGKKFLREAMR